MAISGRAAALAAVLGAAVVAGYWYWSPHLALRTMRAAAQSGDADTLNQHVDYPRLRESLKGQFGAQMAEKLATPDATESSSARAGAALGAMLGAVMVDRMIDTLVRPETIMRAIERGQLKGSSSAPGADGQAKPAKRADWTLKRLGFDRVIAAARSDETDNRGVGFVFDRTGFATWKLTELRLPVNR